MTTRRHLNGRGLVLDNADVNGAAHISHDSIAMGECLVRNARLLANSCADEQCRVLGGTFERTYIAGQTVIEGTPQVGEETILRCKTISGSPRIRHSRLEDIVEVFDEPMISEVYLYEAVTIRGNPMLIGPWICGGFALIHEGTWMRAPRQIKLEHCTVTECVGEKVLVDCRCHTPAWWERHGPKFARRNGWTGSQIEETLEAVRAIPYL